jgi:hypothetical protein
MNFIKFKTQLSELNELVAYLSERFGAEISGLDRDTLVDYLRDMYKSCVENPDKSNQAPAKTQPAINLQKPAQVAPPKKNILLEIDDSNLEEFSKTAVKENSPEAEKAPLNPALENIQSLEAAAHLQTEQLAPEPLISSPQVVTNSPEPLIENSHKAIPEAETILTETVFVLPEPPVVSAELPKNQPVWEIVSPETVEETLAYTETEVVGEKNSQNLTIISNQAAETPVVLVDNQLIIQNAGLVSTAENAEDFAPRFNPDYDELFEFKVSNELSDKLAGAKLEDLHRGFGLNDKYLYINELFAGNAAKFKLAIDFFNNQKHLDDARAYMEQELIVVNRWTSKDKKPLAKDFIKVIRRKYLP